MADAQMGMVHVHGWRVILSAHCKFRKRYTGACERRCMYILRGFLSVPKVGSTGDVRFPFHGGALCDGLLVLVLKTS